MTVPTINLPAQVRLVAYWVYSLGAVALGAIQIGYATIEAPQPDWLTVAIAVAVYLGAALGLVAGSNVQVGTGDGDDLIDYEALLAEADPDDVPDGGAVEAAEEVPAEETPKA